MKLLSLLSVLFFVSVLNSQAQSPAKYVNYVPPSPNTATFQLYGDYPVNYSTGLPEISIPLFSISQQQFSFPVTLSYHASGRRTALNLSPLGVGWALNATCVISRTVKGRPDRLPFQKAPYKIEDISALPQHYDEVLSMSADYAFANDSTRDSQHDIFTYNLNGKSGKFILDEGKAVLLTGEPILIRSISQNYFEITDDNGNVYRFGSQPDDDYGGVEYYMTDGERNNDSWFLNTVTTVLGEQIRFRYNSIYSESSSNSKVWGNMSLIDQYVAEDPSYNGVGVKLYESIRTFQDFYMNYVSAIEFSSGKILFNYDADIKLTSTYLQDKTGKLLKGYAFTYQNIPGENLPNNNSALLSTLSLTDGQGVAYEKHSFDYHLSEVSPATWNFPKQRDWWGYYNGYSGVNVSDFTVQLVTSGAPGTNNIGFADALIPSFLYRRFGTLRKITYPTGGSTQFVYEANKYLDDKLVMQEGPGLRIQQIISSDGLGGTTRKLYKYGENENGAGKLLYLPRKYDFANEQTVINFPDAGEVGPPGNAGIIGAVRIRKYSTTPNPEVAEAYGYPVYYSMVTEYNTDKDQLVKNGKTEYVYSIPMLKLNTRPLPNWGYHDRSMIYQPVYLPPYTESKLISKKVYKQEEATYTLVSQDAYNYETFNEKTIPEIFLARFVSVLPDDPGKQQERLFATSPQQVPFFVYRSVNIETGSSLLVSGEHTTWNNGQAIKESKKYIYNNLSHLYPSVITTDDSKGGFLQTYFKYPSDYTGLQATDPVSAGIANLNYKHVLSPAVELSEFRSDAAGANVKLVKSTFTSYKNNFAVADKIFQVEQNAPITDFKLSLVENGALKIDPRYQAQLSFNQYNSTGKLLEQEVIGNLKEVYLWGYNSTYPVAKITGTDYQSASQFVSQSILDAPVSDDALRLELNKLRVKLSTALVSTFTHAPLVGMTSQTDPRGETSFYEYDRTGRLSTIRNNSNHILKKVEYSLGNNALSAPDVIEYRNNAISESYARSNCEPGLEGTKVSYKIPEGMFTSTVSLQDANNQANAASQLYGPVKANALGECIVPVVYNKVRLTYNVSNTVTNIPVTVKFMQGSTVVKTANFPTTQSGAYTVDLPVGTYYMQFTLPKIFSDKYVSVNVNETGQSWSSDGALFINSDMVSFTSGNTYTITISSF